MAYKLLIVDDDVTNLRFLKLVLASEGFDIRTATGAGEARAVIRGFHPRLILVGMKLADGSGLDFVRQLKAVPETRDIAVVAVTASAAADVERDAREAGCINLLTKPVDVRELRTMIRDLLSAPEPDSDFARQIAEIRESFAITSLARVHALMEAADAGAIKAAAHNWKGVGTSVGLPRVSELGVELEHAAGDLVPGLLASLEQEFMAALHPSGSGTVLPEGVAAALSGRRIGLLGFEEEPAALLKAALEAGSAFTRTLDCFAVLPGSKDVKPFDLVIFNVCAETAKSPWMDAAALASNKIPLIAAGSPEALFAANPVVCEFATDFMAAPWTDLEAACRVQHCLARTDSKSKLKVGVGGPARIVIADDDPTIRSLVSATLGSYGMQCHTANDGREALELIRREVPDAAILDVNMPYSDGFEILAAVREDAATSGVRIILLTARQHETDILRGFRLGADDYLVKPFSPMELAARLERVLAR